MDSKRVTKKTLLQATQNINFTGSVNKTLLKRAKVVVAKNDTSINALFNAELRYLVETFDAAEKSGNQNYKSLLNFLLGNAAEVTRWVSWALTRLRTSFC